MDSRAPNGLEDQHVQGLNASKRVIKAVTFILALSAGYFLLKPVYYELYALSHPFRDNVSVGSRIAEPAALAERVKPQDVSTQFDSNEALDDSQSSEAEEGGSREPKLDQQQVVELESRNQAEEERLSQQSEQQPEPVVTHTVQALAEVEDEVVEEPGTETFPNAKAEAETALKPDTTCLKKKQAEIAATEEVQNRLFKLQHPQDCSKVKFLECDSKGGSLEGTGSRLFFLTRCFVKGLEQNRVTVLNKGQKGTQEMLSPFAEWSNCTMADVKNAKKKGPKDAVVTYLPKTKPGDDMAIVEGIKGGLVPKQYAKRGYFWWKAQEITYALRPTDETLRALAQHKVGLGWKPGMSVHGVQVRRTDKLSEAKPVALAHYIEELKEILASAPGVSIADGDPVVMLASDDVDIQKEATKVKGIKFLKNAVAPKRTIGVFKGRVEKDALDILSLAHSDVLAFTYSSGFGALAFLMKMAREGFCANWVSMDGGKREWPVWNLIGNGGLTGGVPVGSKWASNVCHITKEEVGDDGDGICTVRMYNNKYTKTRFIKSQCRC